MIKTTIKIPVYNCKVMVLVDTFFNINKESKAICKKNKVKHNGSSDYACVITTDDIHTYYILFSKNHMGIKTITHEVTHLGATILNDRDIDTDGDSEAFAYLNGFLAEEIEKIMEDNNLRLITWKELVN